MSGLSGDFLELAIVIIGFDAKDAKPTTSRLTPRTWPFFPNLVPCAERGRKCRISPISSGKPGTASQT